MGEYAIYFDKDNKTYRLPVNPEELSISTSQAIEKHEILNFGQIAVPTHMELTEYSFEVELPHELISYVETKKGFKTATEYLAKFQEWREAKEPIRFLAGMTTKNYKLAKGSIDTYVLIEELTIKETSGEEQDKYVSFKLIEYRDYGKRAKLVDVVTGKKKKTSSNETTNPKSTGYYIVKKGDCLWAIAKKYYGNGAEYNKIYEANKNKIKNPSLIYPGQKLVIPS